MNLPSLLLLLFASPGVAAAADRKKNDYRDRKLSENVKSKGNVTPQIVGGEAAPLGTYPWFVRLPELLQADMFDCGGSLISGQYVLTAARCLGNFEAGSTTAQIGAFASPFGNGTSGIDDPAHNGGQEVQTLTIVEATEHPNFVYNDLSSPDLALLKLEGPATAAPVPLDGHDGRDIVAGYDADKTHLFAIGFGATDSWFFSDVLKHVDLNFVTREECNAALFDDDYDYDYDYYEEPRVFCPGQPASNYCDCESDCDAQPTWCACPEAQECCGQVGNNDDDDDDDAEWGEGEGWDTCPGVGWIPTNANTDDERSIGDAASPDDCIAMARAEGCQIANFYRNGNGTCWCQYGDTETEDDSGWMSCWLQESHHDDEDHHDDDHDHHDDDPNYTSSADDDDYYYNPIPDITDITDSMMCTASTNEDGYEGPFIGDGGGPLFDMDEGTQVGVLSWVADDSGQAGAPSLSSRISAVFPWIQQTVCAGTDDPDSEPLCEGYPTADAAYHTLESGACAVPVRKREHCKRAGASMAMDWKGTISNAKKPGGCVVMNDKVAFNVKGEKGAGCKSHTQCVCAAPYAFEDDKCARPLTKPLKWAACKEAATVLGDAFAWKGMMYKGNQPHGCFASVKRNVHGKITGGELAFNKKGKKGTNCKWGAPCVCSV